MKQHIVCFGDSNTHGYCADPSDSETKNWGRFSENERWTSLLQNNLGSAYQVYEEGLNGRTTVFPDPLNAGLSGLDYIVPCLRTHAPVDLLVIMLGTNDTKERFSVSPKCIALGLERLVLLAKTVPCFRDDTPNILLIAPPPIDAVILETEFIETMGRDCVEKSKELAKKYREIAELHNCQFFDAGSLGDVFSPVDGMHLTKAGHKKFATALTELVLKK
ncbi:MAG: SGNH/GDSL hydrolase family protein [Bacillota bacterium]